MKNSAFALVALLFGVPVLGADIGIGVSLKEFPATGQVKEAVAVLTAGNSLCETKNTDSWLGEPTAAKKRVPLKVIPKSRDEFRIEGSYRGGWFCNYTVSYILLSVDSGVVLSDSAETETLSVVIESTSESGTAKAAPVLKARCVGKKLGAKDLDAFECVPNERPASRRRGLWLKSPGLENGSFATELELSLEIR